jgi:hypothetical protein
MADGLESGCSDVCGGYAEPQVNYETSIGSVSVQLTVFAIREAENVAVFVVKRSSS